MNLLICQHAPAPFSIAERKGVGHPDTLCDDAADAASEAYSRFCVENFGCILNHNCDKFAALGGQVEIGFGAGRFLDPIRFLFSGRFSTHFGDQEVPYRELAQDAVRGVFSRSLRNFDAARDLQFIDLSHSHSSPGLMSLGEGVDQPTSRKFYFRPRGREDVAYLRNLKSNDTSIGVAHAPFSVAERTAFELERWLANLGHAYLGGDIKIMAMATEQALDVTAAIPLISTECSSLDEYVDRRRELTAACESFLQERLAGQRRVSLAVNNRDRLELGEIYMTLTGSSIEMGDEGAVGRGNRINGAISNTHALSFEGAAGKNPVFHVGKVYNQAAQRLADNLYQAFAIPVTVHLISQTGRPLTDPWKVALTFDGSPPHQAEIQSHFDEAMAWLESNAPGRSAPCPAP